MCMTACLSCVNVGACAAVSPPQLLSAGTIAGHLGLGTISSGSGYHFLAWMEDGARVCASDGMIACGGRPTP